MSTPRATRSAACAAAAALVASAGLPAAAGTFVEMTFNLGVTGGTPGQPTVRQSLVIELFDDDRPLTTDNFLAYVTAGRYDDTLMHRLDDDFVLQGGGFRVDRITQTINGQPAVSLVPDRVDLDGNPETDNPTVPNEFDGDPAFSNTRGTLAMAKLGGDPDSATNQFFFNIGNNAANLDNQNGGFTTFARVLGNGMDLIDAFNLMQIDNLNADLDGDEARDDGPFGELPNFGNGQTLLTLESAEVIEVMAGDADFNGVVDEDDVAALTLAVSNNPFGTPLDLNADGVVDLTDRDVLAAHLELPGDMNADGFIGAGDLDIMLKNWNREVFAGAFGAGDLNGDGSVGAGDLDLLLGAWNQGEPPTADPVPVPEPASALLLSLGSVAALRRRRERRSA